MSRSLDNINRFELPAVGIDPITKGTFTIEYAFIAFDEDEEYSDNNTTRANGSFIISSKNNNPLFLIAKDAPLRLQGLVAKVDFGTEKRFIKIESIGNYMIYPMMNGVEDIELNSTRFEILDNLSYLEEVQWYKDSNLL